MNATSSFRKRLPFRRNKEKQSRSKKDDVMVTTSSSTSTAASVSPPLDKARPESAPLRNETVHTRAKLPPLQHVKQSQHASDSTTFHTPPKTPTFSQCNKDSIAAAAALDNAGNLQLEKGEYSRAMKSYERALELKRLSLKRNVDNEDLLASVATSINNIGYLRQKSGASPMESMVAYQDSLRIKREILGPTSLSVGKTLNNIGSVHFSTKQFPQALESYLQAKDIMQHNLGKQHLDVATVLSNIGDVYMAQANRQEAHVHYKEALTIRWMHLEEHSPKIMRLLEKIAVIEMNQDISEDYDSESEDEDRILMELDLPVQAELHNLHEQVEADIREVSELRRKMALDMVKDKLRILKGMRELDNCSLLENGEMEGEPEVPSLRTPPPLSPTERKEALSSVKERLAKLRQSRAMGESSVVKQHDSDGEHDDLGMQELEQELGLEHLGFPKLNLESVIGS